MSPSGSLVPLLIEAQRALGLSQATLGVTLGVSERTGHRWGVGRSVPLPSQLARLAHLVYGRDASLAARIAKAAGTSVQELGLVPAPPPAPPGLTPQQVVDCVVCAAAEAINAPPQAVRAPLLAAFRRARELGISVEVMELALLEAEARPKGSSA